MTKEKIEAAKAAEIAKAAAESEAQKAAEIAKAAAESEAKKSAEIAQAMQQGTEAQAEVATEAPTEVAEPKEVHYKTSDGNVFYTRNNAVYHALKLQDKEIAEVEA